jgi:hypothetical protein
MSELTVALPDGVVATYLDRLGLPRSAAALPEALRTLHLAHLEQIPFENLSVALGEPVDLDLEVLAAKVLGRGRGGFCYELNGLFAHLLTALGYRVTLLAARVWTGQPVRSSRSDASYNQARNRRSPHHGNARRSLVSGVAGIRRHRTRPEPGGTRRGHVGPLPRPDCSKPDSTSSAAFTLAYRWWRGAGCV